MSNLILKSAGVLAGAVLTLGVSTPAAQAEPSSILAGCGAEFNNVTVTGGQASWNLVCASGGITIGGWVKDTKADGKCAHIKAFAGNGDSRVPLATACPKGTVTNFSWRVNNTQDIRAYLYVA
jgi:hypothetical protein